MLKKFSSSFKHLPRNETIKMCLSIRFQTNKKKCGENMFLCPYNNIDVSKLNKIYVSFQRIKNIV
jgi:hypothetical protein